MDGCGTWDLRNALFHGNRKHKKHTSHFAKTISVASHWSWCSSTQSMSWSPESRILEIGGEYNIIIIMTNGPHDIHYDHNDIHYIPSYPIVPLYPHSHSGVLEKPSKKTIPASEIDGNLSYAVAPVLRVVVARQRASTANNSPTLDTNLLWCCEICNL